MRRPPIDVTLPTESARILQTLLESLKGMGYRSRVDEHWTMEFVSHGCKPLTGYEPDELLFNHRISYEEITHEEDRQRVRDTINAALSHKARFELEYRLRRVDGEIRWVSERGTGVWNGTGHLIGIEGIVYDISDQKQAEVASRESERRYQSLFLNAFEGIFLTSVDGSYLDANPALARIYGFDSPEQMIAELSDIRSQLYVQPTRREEFMTQARRDGGVSNFESEVYRRDGTVIWISETARAVIDEDGQVTGYEGMVEDITDRKRYQQSLIAATEAAEAANRAKGQFLANMSHEIRTPMNGIIGMVDLLLDTPLDRTQSDYAATIRDSARSLLTIINDLLDFSKIEAGKMELESSEFNLHEAVEDVAAMTAGQAVAKGLEVIVHIGSDVPEFVTGDAQRLKQCLINLVGNAVKFSSRGEVLIKLTCKHHSTGAPLLRFEVRDDGIGIAPESLNALFQPFVQADSSTTRLFGGTGLGLSIVRRLVSMMNGDIGVESHPGQGSLFWFEVPRAAAAGSNGQSTIADVRTRRVLVADSSMAHCQALTTRLRHAGYDTEWTNTTENALQRMRQAVQSEKPFDVVLAAWQRADKPCAGLGERINANPQLSTTRVVMLTPLDRHADIQQFAQLGFAGYLTKPVRSSELFPCLTQVLARESREWHLQTQPVFNARKSFAAMNSGDGQLHVLVVEDNAVNQKVARRFLERLGYAVTLADNGSEGVELCRNGTFDLVLMDLQMPVMGGLEATRIIRDIEGLNRRTPIIALTAHAMIGEVDRCLTAGMDDFLTKPLLMDQLRQVLAKYGSPPA
jgi:two-component system, sensor histidine kinase and response regulator